MRQDQEHKTLLWWRILSSIALFNIGLWLWTSQRADAAEGYAYWHLRLSLVFTLVCAYRSVLPRIDLERTTLVDSFASSIVLGRTGATVAEVCFATQTALALHELGGVTELALLQTLAPAVVVSLATAQLFCWYSVVTLGHLGHAIEESIWGGTYLVVALALGLAWSVSTGPLAMLLALGFVGCAGYVVFMFTVDVPMYIARWREGLAAEEPRMSVREGLADAWSRREPTRSWAVWKPEVAWLTGYFSMAVWASIALVWLPRV